MKAGIKFGPANWKKILHNYFPECCEVWFRVEWLDKYKEMFSFLKKEQIPTGLHFWAVLSDKVMPNFAYPEPTIRVNSVALLKKTIDIAAKNNFSYVVFHPGSYHLTRIDFSKSCMTNIDNRSTTKKTGEKILIENLLTLRDYAVENKINLYVETLPSREPQHWRNLSSGRLKTHNSANISIKTFYKLAKLGISICNDICHTSSDVISDDINYLFSQLFNKTNRLAAQTKLIHVNTMLPPFNGTDQHCGLLDKDFSKKEIFPSKSQYIKLLRLFKERDDVWVIPEPMSKHIENTKALLNLLEEVG
jgi:hypothetical protein